MSQRCSLHSRSAVRVVLMSNLARLLLWTLSGAVNGQVHYNSQSAFNEPRLSASMSETAPFSFPLTSSHLSPGPILTISTASGQTLPTDKDLDQIPGYNLLPVQIQPSPSEPLSPSSYNQSDVIASTEDSLSEARTPLSSISWTTILTWDTLLTLILPYSIIFVMSVVGNILVIVTLSLNRSMRSVTNIFLLNLAISDLLLGVFCMPFTLVGVLLRRFAFGATMCHLISYLQSVSVAVSVWTLVAMSVERYYAICHPLRSRESRQTLRHAYRMLALVWTLALFCMLPTAIVSKMQLIPQTENYKCREAWPSFAHKEAFTLFLCASLLIIPLVIMVVTYTSIAITLKQSLGHNSSFISNGNYNNGNNNNKNGQKTTTFIKDNTVMTTTADSNNHAGNSVNNFLTKTRKKSLSFTGKTLNTILKCENSVDLTDANKIPNIPRQIRLNSESVNIVKPVPESPSPPPRHQRSANSVIRKSPNTQLLRVSSSLCTIQARQRRVVLMLCVVVIEFFVCWTPIFIVDTLAMYQPALVYGSSRNLSQWLGIDIISACHLLCFCSSCTNPVTYCFMNNRFRQHFCALFRCRTGGLVSVANRAAAAGITQTFATDNEIDIARENSGSSVQHGHHHHHNNNKNNNHSHINGHNGSSQSGNHRLPVVYHQLQNRHHPAHGGAQKTMTAAATTAATTANNSNNGL